MRLTCPQDPGRVHLAPGELVTEADIARAGYTPYQLVAAGAVERAKKNNDGTLYTVAVTLCLPKEDPERPFGCPRRKT